MSLRARPQGDASCARPAGRILRALLALAAVLLAPLARADDTAPRDVAAPLHRPTRVVSLNLAADQLLLVLADRDQIAALTHFATDPSLSPLAEQARGLITLRGEAEEVLGLRPDAVFVGRYSAPQTTALLRRLKLPLHEIDDPPNSFEQIERTVALVGRVVGHPDRASAAIARLRSALADLRASPLPARPGSLLPYEYNHWSPGAGTLVHELILESGHRAATDELGRQGYTQIALEQVLLLGPDAILAPRIDGRAPAMVSLLFRHPVWKRLRAPEFILLPEGTGLAAGLESVSLARSLRTWNAPQR